MTYGDIMEETGCKRGDIEKVCRVIKVYPLSIPEQAKMYIIHFKEVRFISDMMKKTGLCKKTLLNAYEDLGITPPPSAPVGRPEGSSMLKFVVPDPPKVKRMSMSEMLNTVRYDPGAITGTDYDFTRIIGKVE